MDPIKPLDAAGKLLRKHVAGESQKATKSRGLWSGDKASGSISAARVSVKVLHQKVRGALEDVNFDDREQRKKGLKILFEHILAWEFGDDVVRDPRFFELVDRLAESANEQEELVSRLKEVMKADF